MVPRGNSYKGKVLLCLRCSENMRNNLMDRYHSSKPFSSYSNYLLETPKLAANLSAASKAAIPTDEMMVTYIPSLND